MAFESGPGLMDTGGLVKYNWNHFHPPTSTYVSIGRYWAEVNHLFISLPPVETRGYRKIGALCSHLIPYALVTREHMLLNS